ncbi:MAG: NifU family protein [Caldithrix sp.]|nr:NifU family protein [Caldithrix sp.]
MEEKVLNALDSIRPGLQADGGDLQFVRIDNNNVVYVRLVGACGGCPMSTMTLKQGIERIVKMQVPEVTAVEAV